MQAAAVAVLVPGSGPAWLDEARRAALQAFIERGLPDARDELWKYTTLRALQQRTYGSRDDEAASRPVSDDLLRLDGCEGPCAVLVNGVFRGDLSRLDDVPDGVTLQPLSSVLHEQPEPLRFLLDTHANDSDDGFMLLNRALAGEGLTLRVADGVRVSQPLHIVQVGTDTGSAVAWHLRDLIELGAGASLAIVEHHVGDGASGHLANLVRNITLHANAQLDWTIVQQASADATLLRRTDCVLHEHAHLDFHALELGGKLARHELRVDLAGAQAGFDSRGAFVLDGRRHCDTEVLVTHRGRDTVSDSSWRGAVGDRARGVVHGRILVRPGADGSDGSFYNKNLLLSTEAEVDTRPALEIYADEVKANHGATVGQLDENVLFYLRSRGIALDAARRMLVRAFCAVALDGIEPAPLRRYCETLLAAQLPEAGA